MKRLSPATMLSLLEGASNRVAIGCALEAFWAFDEGLPPGYVFWVSTTRNLVVLARQPWVIHCGGVELDKCSFLPATKGTQAVAEAHMVYCRTDMGGGHAILRLPLKGWTSTHRIAAHELPGWYSVPKVRDIEFDAWTPERWAERMKESTP